MYGTAGTPPVPPFPAPDNKSLELIVAMTIQHLGDGEVDVLGAVRYAAIHGWLEGHLEGEECEADCVCDPRWHRRGHPEGRHLN
jgi:hypothetical protein